MIDYLNDRKAIFNVVKSENRTEIGPDYCLSKTAYIQ